MFVSSKSPFKHFLKQNIYLFHNCLQRKSMEEKGNSHIFISVGIIDYHPHFFISYYNGMILKCQLIRCSFTCCPVVRN